MDILKAFKLDDNEYEINIQGDYCNPLFQANQIGKLLDIKNIRDSIACFDEDEKVVAASYTLGGVQNTTFLTEVGLYRLLGISKKPVARIFQKWIFNVLKELRINGKYELNKQIEIEKELSEQRFQQERHCLFLKHFDNKNVIYFTNVKDFDNTRKIIKLGWSDDIKKRCQTLKTTYKQCIFQDVFECRENSDFEADLKKRHDIMCYAYKDPVNGKKSTETLLLDITEYNKVIKIVKQNIMFYQGFNPEQYIKIKELELADKKIKMQEKELDIKEKEINLKTKMIDKGITCFETFDDINKNIILEDDDNSNNEVIENNDVQTRFLYTGDNFPKVNTRNRKIQQYNPDTFELIATFEGLMDVLRTLPQMTKFGITNAATNNTVYKEFRWFYIDRHTENIKYDIPPTVLIHHSSVPQLVAMLNKDNTRIENVFSTQQLAAEAVNSKRKQTINDALKNGNLVRGLYYFKFYKDCTEEVKKEYLSRATLPIAQVNKGTKVDQLDPNTRQIIKTYNSLNDVLKEFCMSRTKLKEICADESVYKGYRWRYS